MGREGKNGDINWGINTFVKRRLPHSGGVRSNSMTSRLSFLSRSSSFGNFSFGEAFRTDWWFARIFQKI